MSAFPVLQQQQLDVARSRFAQGEPLPDTLLPDGLARSWERSRNAGLQPWQAPQYDAAQRLHNVREQPDDRRLYQCVHEEIEQLWSAFGGPDWTIFCANPQGVIVHARHSPSCDDAVLLPIAAGRRMAECDIGTTAPSCVLSDGCETIVQGNQHYLRAFEEIFCLSVPLWGIEGQVIGALDITGRGQRDAGLLQEHFRQAALSAEHRLFATLRHCHLLAIQHDPRWLGTPLAGLLAFDEDGGLRAASRLARRMLGLPAQGAVSAWTLARVFDSALPAQQRRLLQPGHHAQRLACVDGSHLWVQHLRGPLRGVAVGARLQQSPGVAPSVPAIESAIQDSDLQEHTLRAIVQALAEHDGNIAATARQLDVSRTTLYAKLRQARAAGLLPG
ncbi:helix-turn-helix domain-containing protein [Pseudoxanthomonas sp.]|uniref:helix-turn-helix domain-containing protein n=1 Tax=Pseudoxanthomonas sp. TaxID=1871049 RepID=UPI002639BB3E|nr:helix-turn-helix domain-containing protein [Pseudoxanthomonas sp.]WDS34632.1 MAG: helix-turn-helix domain-containing protein [Pseudoxanthomonas sp.]